LKDASGSGVEAATATVAADYRITSSTGVSVTIVAIAAVVVAATWFLVSVTRFGFQNDLVGRNPVMARWQGVDIARIGLIAFAVTGATAGLAGCLEVLGPSGRAVSNYSPNLGFTAILVALVAGRSMLGLVLAGLFFGGLQAATLYLPIVTALPPSGIDSLSGFITLIITISALPLLRRRFRPSRSAEAPSQPAAMVRP
jgi:simple sugar transport system permease protein